ncbi:MAG TPA: glycosyltransferase family 39 protein [Sphingomonas sp.]|nr:glycosyltransferase family 39 protein [Sphingomonas sp.]
MSEAAAPSRREIAALAAILAVAGAIRAATASYPLWFDELASLVFAGQPMSHLWSGWMVRESNPPLYYTLLRGWIALFGDGDRTLRLLSIAIGLGGIAAAWALARRLGGAAAGLVAAALLAVSAAHVAFSQEVRGYALAHTAALVATLAAAGFLERRRFAWLGPYVGAALVALYAHTTMVVFAALAGVTVLWLVRRDRRAALAWIGANAAILAGWAWWGWISLRQMAAPHTNFGWIAPPSLADALRMTEIAYLPPYVAPAGFAGHALLAALIVAIILVAWRDRRPAVILLAVLALGSPIALALLSQIRPILLPRTLWWASGPVVILVALAVSRARPPRLAVALTAALAVFEAAFLAHWLPARQLEAWPSALDAIARADPHAVVLVEGDAMALAAAHYRAPGLDLVVLDRAEDPTDRWGDGLWRGRRVDSAGAAALLRRQGRLFVLARGDHDPGDALRAAGRGVNWPAASEGEQPFVSAWLATPETRPAS